MEHRTEATCGHTGSTYKECTTCHKQIDKKTIPATQHTWSSEWTVLQPATCTTPGVKTHKCTVCGATDGYVTIFPTDHSFDEVVKTYDATCTEAGYETRKCSKCGECKTFETQGPLWHNYVYDHTDVEATCEYGGQDTYRCTNCGGTKTVETNPTGHYFIFLNEYDRTHLDGKGVCCKYCGQYAKDLYGDRYEDYINIH